MTLAERRRRLHEWARRHGFTPRETRILQGFWIEGRDIGASKAELVKLLRKVMDVARP